MSVLSSRLPRQITDEEIEAYHRDGAAVLRGVVDPGWIGRMGAAVDRILANPGSASLEYTPKGEKGRYYGDFFLWLRDEDFRAFMADSAMPELAAQVMRSRNVNFFYDQLLVKEPNTAEPTPLHHDLPYWPVRGEQVMSVWVPFDAAGRESGVVHYVKGSHKWGRLFAPKAFSDSSGFSDLYSKMNMESIDEVEGELDQHEILHWEMEPGDVLIHHPLTLHFAPGNSSATKRRRGLALRYTGDDATWDTRPGTFMQNPKLAATLPEVHLDDGDKMGGELFPKVWPR